MENLLNLDIETQSFSVEDDSPTVSVLWDRAIQEAVATLPQGVPNGPTIASRSYGMMHTAMYDAWSAYDKKAISTQLDDQLQRPDGEITEANKQEAMSYAAHRVAVDLYPEQAEIFDALMRELGYDPNNDTNDVKTPAGVGNNMARALIAFRIDDGANQAGDKPAGDGTRYSDTTGYEPVNSGPDDIVNPEFWTPERVPIDDPDAPIQNFLTPQWGNVTPFALESGSEFRPAAPEPFLLVDGTVDVEAQTITLDDGEVLDIDRSLIGTVINPAFIEQTEEVIEYSANLTDEQKLIAELWEDGGGSSFPPGTWMTLGQFVSARDEHTIDDDAKLFFALGNAQQDAGIATWEAKTFYDYARPVRTVRELGELDLIGEFDPELGGNTIEAWIPPRGSGTILTEDFIAYQARGKDPSPPFAEYTSGHSSFSAAGAEVLKQFTGSDKFGDSVTFQPGESRFEELLTPVETTTLSWDTFTEAADEAGASRLYGGIHFEDGNTGGKEIGRQVGDAVYERSQFYINGGSGVESETSYTEAEVESDTLYFEGEDLTAGTIIADQFANLEIGSDDLSVMIFDTANPTGMDTDLANQDIGNVLILSEDGDSSNPDDSDLGGTVFFNWDNPVDIESVGMLDIESIGGSVVVYGEGDKLLGSYDTSGLTEDGGTASVEIGLQDVSRMEVNLVSSGAITDIDFA